MPTVIILFAHGSRVESANDAVRNVAAELRRAGAFSVVEAAFLELGKPDLASAVAATVGAGADRVVVIPYFLTMGLHLQRDLPRLISVIASEHPGLDLRVTPPLDGHPGLIRALLDLAESGITATSP